MVTSRRHEVEEQYLRNLTAIAEELSALVNVDLRQFGRLDQEVVVKYMLKTSSWMDQTRLDLIKRCF